MTVPDGGGGGGCGGDGRDAVAVPRPPQGTPRHRPRSAAIWIRIGGAWRLGHVECWYRMPGHWLCWVSYQVSPEHPTVAWNQGTFVYSADSIVSREKRRQPPN